MATAAGGAPESFSPYADSDSLTLHYLAQPKGGRFTVELGGKAVRTISTRAAADAVHSFAVPHTPGQPLPPLELTLRGDGEVRLLGAELERDEPGVIVDSLGIGGTRAANMLRWNAPEWTAALAARPPDLWISPTAPTSAWTRTSPSRAIATTSSVLQRFAEAAPGASCVLVGPVDFPRKGDDGVGAAAAAVADHRSPARARWRARLRLLRHARVDGRRGLDGSLGRGGSWPRATICTSPSSATCTWAGCSPTRSCATSTAATQVARAR
ncbi:MAG: hypothetical protein U0168_29980 [Nannocystaceae bacterium]